MRFSYFVTVLLHSFLLLFGGQAFACSFSQTIMPFEPDHARWERYQHSQEASNEGNNPERIPAPVIFDFDILRGTEEPGSSCGDAGSINLTISVPDDSSYAIYDFGTYFRIIDGNAPADVFPDVPMVGMSLGKTAFFTFHWLDGHPSQQQSYDFVLEVFFVSNGLSVGPSTKIQIKSD